MILGSSDLKDNQKITQTDHNTQILPVGEFNPKRYRQKRQNGDDWRKKRIFMELDQSNSGNTILPACHKPSFMTETSIGNPYASVGEPSQIS